MKKMVSFLLMCFFAGGSIFLQSDQGATQTHSGQNPSKEIDRPMSKEELNIKKLWSEWRKAIKAGDIEKLAGLVTEDAEFWAHGAAPLIGRESVKQVFKSFFQKYDSDQEFVCQELIVMGKWAFARGMEINRLTPRAGGDMKIYKQRGFSLMRKGTDGNWRFARGMSNLPQKE